MTEKDYKLIASTLAATRASFKKHKMDPDAYRAVDITIGHFLVRLNKDNPEFDSVLFIQACYDND